MFTDPSDKVAFAAECDLRRKLEHCLSRALGDDLSEEQHAKVIANAKDIGRKLLRLRNNRRTIPVERDVAELIAGEVHRLRRANCGDTKRAGKKSKPKQEGSLKPKRSSTRRQPTQGAHKPNNDDGWYSGRGKFRRWTVRQKYR